MYATAQRVRNRASNDAIHSSLYAHDASFPFPTDPLRVPVDSPGSLVRSHTSPPGLIASGDSVISYVDLIAPEGSWSAAYADAVRALASRVPSEPLPLVARVGPITVIFNGVPARNSADEYRTLLSEALSRIDGC